MANEKTTGESLIDEKYYSLFFSCYVFLFAFVFLTKLFWFDYTKQYFVSILLVSAIPLWMFVYYYIQGAFEHCYKHSLKCLFIGLNQNTDIFGFDSKNILIDFVISSFILANCYFFCEKKIIILPGNFYDPDTGEVILHPVVYLLVFVIAFYGSHAGAITIRLINFFKSCLSRGLRNRYSDEWYLEARILRDFFDVLIIATYVLCGAMYVAVLIGPHDEGITAPLISFLAFMILWPLGIHVFYRIYMQFLKEKIVESRIFYNGLKILKKDIVNRQYLNLIFAGKNERNSGFAVILSIIYTIAQIVLVLVEIYDLI